MPNLNINWDKITQTKDACIKEYTIPSELLSEFFKLWKSNLLYFKSIGYSIKKRKNSWILTETTEVMNSRNVAISEADLDIKPLKDTSGLRPWQIPSAEKLAAIIRKQGASIDGSDLGTGKSYSAIATARELELNIFVVCPKAVMAQWERVIRDHFKMNHKLVGIINYESLRIGKTQSKYASYVKRRETRRKEFVWKIPKDTLIIWDESQKLKNYKTKNSETCEAALKQGYKMLFCSATNATNPLELRTVGTALKLFNNSKQYYKWLYEHGVTKGRFGLEFKGDNTVLNKLHNDIFVDRGVRLSRDTIPNFPESEIIAECYDMEEDTRNKINNIYREMRSELERLKKKEKKDNGNHLTVILREREKIELLKVPLFVEMIEEGIENGMSVVVFLNFTQTIKSISEKLNMSCIFDGKINEKIRQLNVDKFQANKERIILINLQSGGSGLSLHDLDGKFPRMALISPSYSAVNMRQALGRIWRDSAKSKSIQKIVFVAGTVEEKVCKSVTEKLNNLDLINDGILNDI